MISGLLQIANSLIGQDILTSAMASLAAGLVTLTVAVAIFLGENGELFDFDRKVILARVVKSKSFLRNFLSLFLPLFVWHISPNMVRILLFILYATGVYGFLAFLYRSHKWIEEIEMEEENKKGDYRQEQRREYIENIQPSQNNLKKIWESIWKLDHISTSVEEDYVEKFVEKLSSLLNEGDHEQSEEYLRSLVQSIDSISLEYMGIFRSLWEASLKWHKDIFEKYKRDDTGSEYLGLRNISQRLIRNLLENGVSFNHSHIIFDGLETTVEDNLEPEKNKDYLNDLISIVAPEIFTNVDSKEGRAIWSNYFPSEWKVTLNHIQDENNYMASLWLKHFLKWAERRIQKHHNKKSLDKPLDNTTRNLFPNVDPRTFSIILSFRFMSSWPPEKRMEKFVESKRNFGFMSHIQSGFMSPEEDITEGLDEIIEEENQNAVELSAHVFRRYFTEERLKEWIKELESLDLDDESLQRYREDIKEIFERLKNQVKS